jgi:formylglycine-generating enzyme required for sulfatase activity
MQRYTPAKILFLTGAILAAAVVLVAGCGGTEQAPVDPPACTETGQTWTRPTDGMEMVCVPVGEFLMGNSYDDPYAADAELPEHTVLLDAYWIDRTEVTNAQYRMCVEAGACSEPANWEGGRFNNPEQPVVNVSWHDAQDYAVWLGGRLPTEAEWEKAASWDPEREEKRAYPWGQTFDAPSEGPRLNYCDAKCEYEDRKDLSVDDGYSMTAPVGSYPAGASPYGALDMAGNVSEWVNDWYDREYYAASPERNPQGPGLGEQRVLRGGSFFEEQWEFRSTGRMRGFPDFFDILIGFRVVMDPGP